MTCKTSLIRFAVLGGCLALAACTDASPPAHLDLQHDFEPSPAAAAASGAGSAAQPARPGYAIVGAGFSGLIEFDEEGGRPVILYRHAVDGAPALVAELEPARDWLSDGRRRFEGVSDRGVPVEVVLASGPCEAVGRVHARSARVAAGRLEYEGCARETGPNVRWSEALPRFLDPISACLEASRSSAVATLRAAGPTRVVHARREDGVAVIRFKFGETGRWDCLAGPARPQWRVVASDAPDLPGEGDPVFAPGRPPEAGEACYLWEHVRDRTGAVIGALGEDACTPGIAAGAPAPVPARLP